MAVVQLNVKAAVYGGSHRYYHEQLDKFFQQFLELNVQLVFFGGGTKAKDKLAKLASKVDQDFRKYSQMLSHIDKMHEVKVCARPELRVCLALYEEGIARKYGQWKISTGSLNKDIVQYSQSNGNVVAILAKDSDFLLYDLGAVQYWSCGIEDMSFKDMTTVSFNHAAMLDHLKLTRHQFHALLAISGVILDEPKTHCHRVKKSIFKTKNPGSIQIIRSISDCIRKGVTGGEEAKPNFGAWTTMIFTTASEEYCWLIEKQFKKYDTSTEATNATGTDDVRPKYKNVWSIVNDEVTRVDHNFMELGRWNGNQNAMAYHSLFVLVFKRAMGIVLHSKKDEEPKRRFMMKGHETERCKILPKALAYPPCKFTLRRKTIKKSSCCLSHTRVRDGECFLGNKMRQRKGEGKAGGKTILTRLCKVNFLRDSHHLIHS